jgi:serine/threonine-protein kinase SRK2
MHRDLKLDNTLLDGSTPPIIKICDFGYAKVWKSEEEAVSRSIIGTPVYMSPEVLTAGVSHRGYDGRLADVWSSGIVLSVMLLGAFPYDNLQDVNLSRNLYLQHMKI